MSTPPEPLTMTEAQIKHMVGRFLGWKLPRDFCPDNGIHYERPNYAHAPADHDWPTGTNLFDADQTNAMVRYMIEGMPGSMSIAQEPLSEAELELSAMCAALSRELARVAEYITGDPRKDNIYCAVMLPHNIAAALSAAVPRLTAALAEARAPTRGEIAGCIMGNSMASREAAERLIDAILALLKGEKK